MWNLLRSSIEKKGVCTIALVANIKSDLTSSVRGNNMDKDREMPKSESDFVTMQFFLIRVN